MPSTMVSEIKYSGGLMVLVPSYGIRKFDHIGEKFDESGCP